ncbi:sensor histidine kinase [Faecalicatena contorta]|uniref:sensor histidine kinase n=1 Tax=Faecalicatena contorta TaxID=39482 RepID=UPI00189A4FCA|nr:HAMP domain-containing sensor histidine kinase [Faecalicatena contorta]
MKSLPKLIRRFVGILLLSSVLLIVLNIVLLFVFTMRQMPNAQPWKTAEEVAAALHQSEDGKYVLTDEMTLKLRDADAWGIFIDNDTKQVVWRTDNLPDAVPTTYSLSDIASLTRGYINGYPTFTGEAENGLVVLGYPKDSFWKHMWSSWDYQLIANLPKTVFSVLIINVIVIFIIYIMANTKLLKSVKPITKGIQDLSAGEPVQIKESGLLSEISANINRTSDILQGQKTQLRKKETARANWIAGVSHDIRTPLSMVMGYAGQLKDDTDLTPEEQKKAEVIVRQSKRIQNLINDLNLASKLEYNMQPINLAKYNLIAIVRQVVVDFMNMDIEDNYPIQWETDEALITCPINADRDLLKRAIGNLIQNSINHNEQGCKIYVGVTADGSKCTVYVSDDGIGATDEQIEKLNNTSHYMVCDENTTEQRHGLGLLIVKQIVSAHGGTTIIEHSSYDGFSVKITLPMQE